MINLIKCYKCNNKIATWYYTPCTNDIYTNYLCEDCVPRGCSCNLDEENNMPVDDLGRDLPCCEFDFSEKGFKDPSINNE